MNRSNPIRDYGRRILSLYHERRKLLEKCDESSLKEFEEAVVTLDNARHAADSKTIEIERIAEVRERVTQNRQLSIEERKALYQEVNDEWEAKAKERKKLWSMADRRKSRLERRLLNHLLEVGDEVDDS